jgi:fatty acid desaturase
MFAAMPLDSWWSMVAAAAWGIVRVGTYVRTFVVMHDALHGALFKRHWKNKLAALITGLLSMMDAEGEDWAQHGRDCAHFAQGLLCPATAL